VEASLQDDQVVTVDEMHEAVASRALFGRRD